jgi:hypothetical protein
MKERTCPSPCQDCSKPLSVGLSLRGEERCADAGHRPIRLHFVDFFLPDLSGGMVITL